MTALKTLSTTIFLLGGLSLSTLLFAHDSVEARQINVQGEASQLASPDIANLRISVEARGSQHAEAMTQLGERVQQVIYQLGTLVSMQQLRATDTQMREVVKGTQRHWRRDSSEPMEILATRQVQLEKLPIGELAEAMKLLSSLPIARIDSVQTGLAEPQALQHELMLLAIDDAKRKAKAMAKRLGMKLGLPLAVNPSYNGPHRPQLRMQPMAAMEVAADAGGGYEAVGQDRVEARVSIRFELEAP